MPVPGTLFRRVPSRVSSNAGASAVRLQVRALIDRASPGTGAAGDDTWPVGNRYS